jgi:hypothetical protein
MLTRMTSLWHSGKIVMLGLLMGFSAVAMIGLIGNSSALADTPTKSALSVNPAITEEVLTPGTTSVEKVRVTNITSVPLPIKGSIKNLIMQESLIPAADKSIYDASAWFTLNPSDFILQPNETKEITVSIATPAQATPGGHYATVYFQPLIPSEALSPSTTYLTARVGVLSFLVVKGAIVEQASLSALHIPTLEQFGPVPIKVAAVNSGNVHLLPKGDVVVRNWRGKQVSKVDLPTGLVLPKTVKNYTVVWKNHAKYGYFTAQAAMTYGADNEQVRTAKTGFWVIPWLPLLMFVALIVATVWFVRRTHRRWKAAWDILRGKA